MTDDLAKLQERVMNGTVWLASHDPGSRFHLWFEAGLTPISRMPVQDDETRAAYREYFGARTTFEQLDRELARLEAREPAHVAGLGDLWQPTDPQMRKEVRQRG